MIDEIGRSIDNVEGEGLKSLEIDYLTDQNSLEAWPLSQLVTKCPNLEIVKISDLDTTTDNCCLLLDFVGQACTFSQSMRVLWISDT